MSSIKESAHTKKVLPGHLYLVPTIHLLATKAIYAYVSLYGFPFIRNLPYTSIPYTTSLNSYSIIVSTMLLLLLLVLLSHFSCVRLCVTLRTADCKAPVSMEFSRQEYWSGLPFPSPGDLPNPGIEHQSPALQADSLPLRYQEAQFVPYDLVLLFPTNGFKYSVQFSHSAMSDSLQLHESQHARPPYPSPSPGVHPNSCASSRWYHPAFSSSVVPFSSCPQSLPASESFPMSQLFASGGQSIGVSVSASVLPMNTQGLSPLEWTGWISLQSKGLSRVFSNATVQKHQFFSAQLSSQSNSHIHTWPLEKP